jgi:alanine racemase
MRSRHVDVTINLDQVRSSAERIRDQTRVPIIAVIKTDAYGCGAAHVADALAGVVHEFAYFNVHEAREVGRPGLIIGPPEGDPAQYRELGLRPTLMSRADTARFRDGPVAISVDTGMQRFGCDPADLDEMFASGRVHDMYTHPQGVAAVARLRELGRGRGCRLHAACTSLLPVREAWLDAVRPGFALYRGSVRVTTRLHAVRSTYGPAGYTSFAHPHIGIILAGYSNLVREGPIVISGRRQRLLEVGMNSSFASVDPRDRVGDEVVLLGDGLTEEELGAHHHCRPHEILCRYTAMGQRRHVCNGAAAADAAVGLQAILRR